MSRKSMSSKVKSRKSMTRKSMARKTLSDKSSSGKSSGKSNRFRASKANGTPWVEELKSLEINDDNWKYHVTIIEEQKSEFSGLLDSTAQYAMKDGNRLEVRFISSDFMKEKVLNHCARTNETSAYSALCEAIKQAGEDQPNNFQEKQLNFVLPRGSRLGLKYDESVFNRTELMVKTFVEGHMLCFHVPLYGETRPIKFILEHENGMILSFSESVSPQRRSSETSINKAEDTATESMSEASTAKESLAKQERLIEEKRLKKYNELRSKFEEEYYAKMGKSKHSSSKTDDCVVKIIQEQLKEYCDESINLQYKKTTHKHSKMKLRFVSVPFNDPIFNSDDEETSQSVVFDLQISWPNGL